MGLSGSNAAGLPDGNVAGVVGGAGGVLDKIAYIVYSASCLPT